MKKRIPAVFCLILVLAMIVSACTGAPVTSVPTTSASPTTTKAAGAETTTASTEATPREVITLDYMSNANVPGLASGKWWTKKLEEDIGVKLNIISFSPEVYNAALAANDLPDLVYLTTASQYVPNSTAADLLVNFDDYADLLPNMYAQCSAGSLQFQRDKFGDGEKLYTIPDGMTTEYQSVGGIEYGFRVIWDYYMEYVEQNGEPVLKDIEDFLPLFKAIQDKHPTNEDGQKTYSMTYFPAWDSSYLFQLCTIPAEMYGYTSCLFPLEINTNDLSYQLFWEDDGIFKRIMDFFFQANQLGLLDPDAATQTWDDYGAKFTSHRIISYWCWGGNTDVYKLLPFENMSTNCYSGPWLLGNTSGESAIWASSTSEPEVIERVCEFVNYCMDYDNAWYLWHGPQGEYWDLNKEGTPYVTEFGEKLAADPTLELSVGGNPATESIFATLGYWRFINPRNIHPTYGVPISGGWALRNGFEKNAVQISWENAMTEKYKVTFNGQLSEIELVTASQTFAEARIANPVIPAEIKDFYTRMSSVYETFWQMAYAKNQTEYDSLWTSAQATLQEMFDSTGYTAESLFNLYNTVLEANSQYFN